MSFTRPTLAEIVTRAEGDAESRLELTGALLRRAMARVHALIVAGASHMLHGHLDFLSRQMFPDQSEEEFLLRQAATFGITKTAATFAQAILEATGVDGSVIPAGTILVRSDGAEYTVDDEATIASGTADLDVTASDPGADSTLTADVVLTFSSPIAGVDSEATVDESTLDGSDEESTEALRERFLARLQDPPHGGSESDYEAWALESDPGVTRAWVYPLELGAGTVVVRAVRDNDADLIPSAGEITAIQEYIDERRPVTAAVTVVAPVDTPIDFTIEIDPDNSDNRAAVEAELVDMLQRTASPGSTTQKSAIDLAVGNAATFVDFAVTVPAADVTRTTGQLSTVGDITWL